MAAEQHRRERVLGIDLGTNSVGWALLEFEDGAARGIAGAGVRVFEAGVEGDIRSGRDESRNKARREKRLQRRQFDRRARRNARVASLLQRAGLLPPGNVKDKQWLHEVMMGLDREIYRRHAALIDERKPLHRTFAHVLPYWLRARALDTRLEPDELGRAIYHLAQRRGFLSNRKAVSKKETEEDRGKVKEGIAELERKMREAGSRTLGEFFSTIDPEEERIRSRWTARSMYRDEFERIWKAQSPYYPGILTPEFKNELYRAIFRQRPLKLKKSLVGKCELEPTEKRAPWALLDAQRFRLLQKVNDLEILLPDGSRRKPSDQERTSLLEALEREGDQKFARIRKMWKLPKGATFSHEAGGEEKLPGNRTASKLYAIFGDRWPRFCEEERNRIVEDMRSIRGEDVLARRGMRKWGLDPEKAKAFGAVTLEEGHCSHSRKALRKLLPLMETGMQYMSALDKAYPERKAVWSVLNMLPPVTQAPFGELRNPMVERSLNELRKVVNAIIRKYGKPDRVRIELARDLKRNRKDREAISKHNRDNEKARAKAAKLILDETGMETKKRDDILKVLLAEECNWECPYTGKHISIGALLGETPQFDIDHIIPRSRCLDDSFMNKTLCFHEVNRTIKSNRTPFEAFGSDADRWSEIIERVKRFKGRAARAKLERFCADSLEPFEEFSNRQLNDTRHASRKAGDFVGLLYGGQIDASGTRRIQVGRGEITACLREVWNLNKILGDGGEKSREDHRHHAVDAICIALTSPATVKMLSDAAQRAPLEKRRRFASVPEPWPGFFDDVKRTIESIIVSHRVNRKVNGPLHEETIYGPGSEEGYVHVRKPLAKMSAGEIDDIVDPAVKEKVKAALRGGEPGKVFSDPKSLPSFETPDGRRIPIKKARIRRKLTPFKIGSGYRERLVMTDSNHHVEIVEVKDKRGNPKWEGHVVSRYEAMQRKRRGEPIVVRDHGEGKRFVFSLSPNETVQMKDQSGEANVYQVVGISQFTTGRVEIVFKGNADARPVSKLSRQGRTRTPETLRKAAATKVMITPLGEVRRAGD